MYKKVWCTCEVAVLLIKPIVFWLSLCRFVVVRVFKKSLVSCPRALSYNARYWRRAGWCCSLPTWLLRAQAAKLLPAQPGRLPRNWTSKSKDCCLEDYENSRIFVNCDLHLCFCLDFEGMGRPLLARKQVSLSHRRFRALSSILLPER